MILRDQHGEIEVPFVQDFEYKGATLTVVCPAEEPIGGHAVIWCRLQKGTLELNGSRFEIAQNGHKPVLPFASDLVAHQVRLYRLGGLQLAPENPKAGAAKQTRKPRQNNQQHPAETATLFD